MAGPVWARWLFALLFAATGLYCMVRLLLVRRLHVDLMRILASCCPTVR